MKLTFRIVKIGDEEKLSTFNKKTFGIYPPNNYWKWKYFNNPAGPPCVAIALDGEKIVGRVGTIPLRVKLENELIVAGQSLDTAIIKEYRKGGTFFKLAKLARTVIDKNNIAFDFGFAIEDSLDVSTKFLKFNIVSPVNKLVKVIDPTPYLIKRKNLPFPKKLGNLLKKIIIWKIDRLPKRDKNLFKITHFDNRFDNLWKETPKEKIMVIKDSTFLNWRYVNCPAINYKIVSYEEKGILEGFVVFHSAKWLGVKYGFISDLICRQSNFQAKKYLLSASIKLLIEGGAESIKCWLPKHHYLYPVFKKLGFRKRFVPNYLLVKNYKKNIKEGLLQKENNWIYTIGDSDYFLISK